MLKGLPSSDLIVVVEAVVVVAGAIVVVGQSSLHLSYLGFEFLSTFIAQKLPKFDSIQWLYSFFL